MIEVRDSKVRRTYKAWQPSIGKGKPPKELFSQKKVSWYAV